MRSSHAKDTPTASLCSSSGDSSIAYTCVKRYGASGSRTFSSNALAGSSVLKNSFTVFMISALSQGIVTFREGSRWLLVPQLCDSFSSSEGLGDLSAASGPLELVSMQRSTMKHHDMRRAMDLICGGMQHDTEQHAPITEVAATEALSLLDGDSLELILESHEVPHRMPNTGRQRAQSLSTAWEDPTTRGPHWTTSRSDPQGTPDYTILDE